MRAIPPKIDKDLANVQTAHPVPPRKPYTQRKVADLLLRYERQLDQCRAKIGITQ